MAAVTAQAADNTLFARKHPVDRTYGNPDAPVKVLVLNDFSGKTTYNFFSMSLPHFITDYVDTEQVYLMIRSYPNTQNTLKAAVVEKCIPDNRLALKFMQYAILKQDKWLGLDDPFPALIELALHYGFDKKSFTSCVYSPQIAQIFMGLRKQLLENTGMKKTPIIFVNGEEMGNGGNIIMRDITKRIREISGEKEQQDSVNGEDDDLHR